MADLVIVAADVKVGSNAQTATVTAGEAITAGQVVYLDSVSGKYLLSDNDVDAPTAVVRGIALDNASIDQPVVIQTSGEIILGVGSFLTVGETYHLTDTPGGIGPIADLLVGQYVSLLGVAISGTTLRFNAQNSGVQKA